MGTFRVTVDDAFWTSRVAPGGAVVEAVAFSAVLAEVHPTFLILDGEGIEAEVVAEPLPAHVRKLVVELHPDVIGRAECAAIVKRLTTQGFAAREDLTDATCSWRLASAVRVPRASAAAVIERLPLVVSMKKGRLSRNRLDSPS